jgi:hypothetical protein
MAINPELITTIRVDQLPDETLSLTNLFPHTVGTDLKSATIQELVDLVATTIGVSGGVGYIAISVTDGQQLPSVPELPSFFLCGAGTFLNVNGYPDVICTENLNAVMSLTDHWELAVEIPINPLSGTVQSVTGSAVDNTDPLNPVINEIIFGVQNIIAGTNITVDNTDPANPIISATGGGTTPTLQEVTDQVDGNTTTKAITLTNDTVPLYIGYNGSGDVLTFTDGGVDASLGSTGLNFTDIGGYGALTPSGAEFLNSNKQTNYNAQGVIYNDNITNKGLDIQYPTSILGTDKVQTFQDADGVIALTSDIPTLVAGTNITIDDADPLNPIISATGGGTIPTLQEVATVGNTLTDTNIIFDSAFGNKEILMNVDDGIYLKDIDSDKLASIEQSGLSISNYDGTNTTFLLEEGFSHTSSGGFQKLTFENITSEEEIIIPNATGTIALTSDIPTNTSDLTNDGADGINPFITALDIPSGGSASTLVREVKNMTGATLTKGTVVYISGANGNKALVSKALATTDALSARTFGLLQSDILNNGLGNCVVIGDLSGINTSAFTEGAQLYLSGVTAGAFTDTRVLAPTHLVYVGKVTRSHPTQGQIEVQIQNGYELAEIHDVQIITPLNNQALTYESSTDLWKNKTIIEDSITDGVTAIAPSQNAVFDALALKQSILAYTPYRNIQTSQTVHTGTTSESPPLFTATIPATAFSSTDIIRVLFGANKTTALGTYTLRLRINTTNTVVGAPTIATYSGTATAQVNIMQRNFNLNGGNLYGFAFTSSTLTDIIASGQTLTSTTLNPANQFFIFATIQLANASDSIIGNMLSISN